MILNLLVQKVHLYTGLQASLALLIYALATIAATFHGPGNDDWEVTQAQFTGPMASDKMALAWELHAQVGLQFEPSPVDWMVSETEDGKLQIRYFSPNGSRVVKLDRESREVELRSLRNSFSMYLNRMHTEGFGRRKAGDSLWLWAWALYIELSLIALFVLPATGLYLFLDARQRPLWANYSLLFSGTAMAVLWYLLRS
jgi:hypothetical protein